MNLNIIFFLIWLFIKKNISMINHNITWKSDFNKFKTHFKMFKNKFMYENETDLFSKNDTGYFSFGYLY